MKTIILLSLLLLVGIFGTGYYYKADRARLGSIPPIENPTPQSDSFTSVAPTPDISRTCPGQVTPSTIEGPYYKEGSPERTNIVDDQTGERLELNGYVFDTNCNPVAHAWVDFWQANSVGLYDNEGYRLRGHQRTDSQGRYHLETIIPGEYESRTPHIHAKVQATSLSPQVTAQLYIPGEARNTQDPIFNESTMINMQDSQSGKVGSYNFVVLTQ